MKKTVYFLLFAWILAATSCVKKDPETGAPNTDPQNGNECTSKGTIKEHNEPATNCFVRLIEKEDGSLLEPIDQKELYANGIHPGQHVNFSYEESAYSGSNCTSATPVKLTCLKSICSERDLTACASLTLVKDLPQESNVTINNAVLTENCLELEISFSGCCSGTEDIQLQWDEELVTPSYPTTALLSVIHTHPTTCEALIYQKSIV